MLAQLPTSAAEDEALLAGEAPLPPRLRLAIEYRLERKRLLQRCIARHAARGPALGFEAGAMQEAAAEHLRLQAAGSN